MPRGVFYGLWKTLKSGEEFFGFVKNTTADGFKYTLIVHPHYTAPAQQSNTVDHIKLPLASPAGTDQPLPK